MALANSMTAFSHERRQHESGGDRRSLHELERVSTQGDLSLKDLILLPVIAVVDGTI